MIDCGQLQGARRQQICRGIDDEGLPVLDAQRRRAYLVKWGFSDEEIREHLRLTPSPPAAKKIRERPAEQKPKPKSPYGAGTELQKIFRDRGVPSCQDCKDLADKMNAWGIAECVSRAPQIVELIFPRAKTWVKNRHPFVSWLFPKTTDAAIRDELKLLVGQAIDIAAKKVKEPPNVKWAYGLTTIPERRDTLFPKTIQSLRLAGFQSPRIFCDGGIDPKPYEEQGFEVTLRHPKVKAFGNWILALWELYVRNPLADRYALFQDDVVFVRNLREYLDRQAFPEKGYWNLFSFMKANEDLIQGKPQGWHHSDQYGRGALALVFNRDAVAQLLSVRSIAMKPQHAKWGEKRIDGAVVTALAPTHKQPGGEFVEWIHNPSLVQHTGDHSSLGNHNQPKALTFPGEDFDALTLLPKATVAQ